jgi:hypothetical protein
MDIASIRFKKVLNPNPLQVNVLKGSNMRRIKRNSLIALAALYFLAAQPSVAAVQMSQAAFTDLSITSVKISWITDSKLSDNRVEVRIKGSDSLSVFQDSYLVESYTHSIDLTGLQPGKEYEYRIHSGSNIWDNSGKWYSFKTLSDISGTMPSGVISGRLLNQSGQPLERALVRLRVVRSDGTRSVVNTVLTSIGGENPGSWYCNLANFKDETLGMPLNPGAGDRLHIEYLVNYWTSDADSSVVLQSSASRQIPERTIQLYDPALGMRGDLDNNGKINVFDLLDILKILGGSKTVTGDPRLAMAADVDGNGKYDVFDLLALLRLLGGSAA